MNSWLKLLVKGLYVVYLSDITTTTLTFRDRTADITYCADVTLILHAKSGGLPCLCPFCNVQENEIHVDTKLSSIRRS